MSVAGAASLREVTRCETPKSPPGDYNSPILRSLHASRCLRCETPKSPPGDYNSNVARCRCATPRNRCETPKSPPGDYNRSRSVQVLCLAYYSSCVKHLNPRQGITTPLAVEGNQGNVGIECETPKSPPGDYNRRASRSAQTERARKCETPKSPPGDYNSNKLHIGLRSLIAPSVKHLNPRQGITTSTEPLASGAGRIYSVKHLNPRQGITTADPAPSEYGWSPWLCETPKSPPGDYNLDQHDARKRE